MKKDLQKGQTLVLLLVFVMVAISVTTAAIFIISSNSRAVTGYTVGAATKLLADSGAEKAMLGIIRDPSYSGETFTEDTTTVTVTVTGTTTKTITSTAVNGDFTRVVEVIASNSDNVVTLVSWKDKN